MRLFVKRLRLLEVIVTIMLVCYHTEYILRQCSHNISLFGCAAWRSLDYEKSDDTLIILYSSPFVVTSTTV